MHPFTTTCRRCRRDFEATRSDARYCSGSCRAAASRETRHQRELAFMIEYVRVAAGVETDASRLPQLGATAATLFGPEIAEAFRLPLPAAGPVSAPRAHQLARSDAG